MPNQLQWDSMQLRRKASRLTMMHKIVNDQVAIPASKFLQPAQRPTRLQNTTKAFLIDRTPKRTAFNQSFFPRTIAEWNYIPEHIINTASSDTFKTQVTAYLRETSAKNN